MPKLKVYSISNLDGRRSAIVAASTKAAACEALCVRGNSRSEVVPLDGRPGPAYSDVLSLAVATPGIPWYRSICSGSDGRHPWRCGDGPAGARAIVRARSSEVGVRRVWYSPPRFEIWAGDYDRPIGSGPTEDAAWLDAAARISVEPPPGLPLGAVVAWRPEDAPEQFRALRPDGRWYAYVPDGMYHLGGHLWAWAAPVERYPVRGGEVRIGLG